MILYAAIIFLFFLFFYFEIYKFNGFSTILTSFICSGFIILLVIYSKSAVSSAKSGINLWFNIVFPSLFPFFVLSEILNRSGIFKFVGKFFEPIMRPVFNLPGCTAFSFILGVLSGYPIGAKTTLQLYEQKLITRTEAERLLTFTNNSGPLFVISAIGTGFLCNKRLGILLYICHIFSAISVGILFKYYKKNDIISLNSQIFHKKNQELHNNEHKSGYLLSTSVLSSMQTILNIAGFIIFFSVIIQMLFDVNFFLFLTDVLYPIWHHFSINRSFFANFLSGFIEITTGISLLCKINIPCTNLKLIFIGFLLGWAGISIHFQVYSVLVNSDIKIYPYLIGKLIQGILNALYVYLFIYIFF